ncbi:multifunctional CCA tRNA nucleotidyl transferase/2'3'-cyclic phosphodiesterase/2'nucleotidase/phosphatase [Marinobacter changyiensis]|uniref:multifunctional CCA tRNA nucleotidyl transferase/2'3'-cyclic phosphodiesterase/2'nucleotidase/phosphatase n=1 Tax=Marinobacter changyiensis TaxID=2604091 RepID=UPI00126449AA|nr:multifunctional CCA tRNA nucleotidyl transferase/2'3'-cyclic phosphodiesterase/2'nucleotidase/phosphatase [Marinobacter changyiensis]
MKTYLVGGAVRDELLGLPVKDRDWVVTGATPQEMLQQGFRQVGADFPVFLHPESQEEYALARTERKQGHGYHGFSVYSAPDVTLEDDLLRRDLTINAMARATDGTLIDPFNGQSDLASRTLRHVSDAFAEDPLRILRTARFAARFCGHGFTVADETLHLMTEMVQAGEVEHLVPERVWQEIARALQERAPTVFFDVLQACGALARLIPELNDSTRLQQAMASLGCTCQAPSSTDVRFAALLSGLDPADAEKRADAMKAPNECQELARLTTRLGTRLTSATSPEDILALLNEADVWRRPERFERLLAVCECLPEPLTRSRANRFRQALETAQKVQARELMAQGHEGKALGEAIRQERLRRIAELEH